MKLISYFFQDTLFTLTCIRWCHILLPAMTFAIICWLLIILPQHRKQQHQKQLVRHIKEGMYITTIHGISGIACAVSENFIILECSDGRKIEIVKQTIAVIHHESP
jgi:preprotein translocase YajC subunit